MLRRTFARSGGLTLLKTAVGNAGLRVGSAGLGLLSSIVLARLLGAKEFGVYALVMAGVNLAATVAALGLPALVTREVARYQVRERWSRLASLVRTTHRWVIYGTLAVLAVAGALLGAGVLPELHWSALLPTMLLIPLMALNQLRGAILRGLHWVILADVPELLARPLVMLLLVSSIFFWLGRAGAALAIGLQLAAVLCAFALGTQLLRVRIPRATAPPESRLRARIWAAEAQPFFWITLASLVEGQIGMYILGYLAGPKQVGLFQVASQLVMLVGMGLVAVNMPLQPKLAAAWAKGDKAQAQRLVAEAARLATIAAVAAAVILIPFAEAVIRVYGEQYAPAANVLRILVAGQLINAACGPCGLVLAATGHQKFALQGLAAALVANALISMILVPHYASTGTAIAATASLLVWNGLLVYWAWRLADLVTPIFPIAALRARV